MDKSLENLLQRIPSELRSEAMETVDYNSRELEKYLPNAKCYISSCVSYIHTLAKLHDVKIDMKYNRFCDYLLDHTKVVEDNLKGFLDATKYFNLLILTDYYKQEPEDEE